MTEEQRQIVALWDQIEREHQDISTERLLAATAQRMSDQGRHTTEDQVVAALEAEHRDLLMEKAKP